MKKDKIMKHYLDRIINDAECASWILRIVEGAELKEFIESFPKGVMDVVTGLIRGEMIMVPPSEMPNHTRLKIASEALSVPLGQPQDPFRDYLPNSTVEFRAGLQGADNELRHDGDKEHH